MVTVTFVLVISAFLSAVVALAGKCPLGVPVLLLTVIHLLALLPH